MLNPFYLASAFGLGAAHALEPGHGKTIVAAYLSGTKGRLWDALLIGIIVTISHTLSVFTLAMLGLYLAETFFKVQGQFLMALQVLSGLMILGIGLLLYWRRFVQDKTPDECECHLPHVHHDDLIEHVAHAEDHKGHHHAPLPPVNKNTSSRELISLGIASGISPCPSAIAAMFASFAIGGPGHLLEAFIFLLVFSLGLSSVLVGIGALLISSSEKLSPWLLKKNSQFPVLVSKVGTALMILLGLYFTVKPLLWPETLAH